jgi:hypothetical protein
MTVRSLVDTRPYNTSCNRYPRNYFQTTKSNFKKLKPNVNDFMNVLVMSCEQDRYKLFSVFSFHL